MQNKKSLAVLSLLRKIFEIFSNLFFNIYLYTIVQGDFNFLLSYAAFSAVLGCIFGFIVLKCINSKNANFLFKMSFMSDIASILLLLIMKDNLISFVWLFAVLQRFAKSTYYAVYEVTLIRSTKTQSLSSYIAGVNILSSLVAIMAPVLIGYTITNYSWHLVFILMLIDAGIAAAVASKVNFKVIQDSFHPIKYWRKISQNKTMRHAYSVLFLRRLSSTDGVLEYLLPVLLFLALGTELSVGNYDSLFSTVYIVMLEGIRIINKKGIQKKFYVPMAFVIFASSILMVTNFTITSILIFYFMMKTFGALINLEGSSMIYAIGNKEKLSAYTREHQMTWNIALTLGNLVGVAIAYVIYNNFYSKDVFAIVILVLMVFFVIQAHLLQKVEQKLQNG